MGPKAAQEYQQVVKHKIDRNYSLFDVVHNRITDTTIKMNHNHQEFLDEYEARERFKAEMKLEMQNAWAHIYQVDTSVNNSVRQMNELT